MTDSLAFIFFERQTEWRNLGHYDSALLRVQFRFPLILQNHSLQNQIRFHQPKIGMPCLSAHRLYHFPFLLGCIFTSLILHCNAVALCWFKVYDSIASHLPLFYQRCGRGRRHLWFVLCNKQFITGVRAKCHQTHHEQTYSVAYSKSGK